MSLFFLFKARSAVAAAIGAVRPFLHIPRQADIHGGNTLSLDGRGIENANGGESLAVRGPGSNTVRVRRGGVPLG